MLYDYNGVSVTTENETNAIIAAHRGYHATAAQNSADSIIEASKAGFYWVELDIRKTADGVLVLAHDNSVTMYSSGTAKTVKFSTANYSTIKGYTWDAAGNYPLCTLAAAFNTAKCLDMHIICDRKTGTNEEIVQVANECGATDRIMLSYYSFAEAVADLALLNRYGWIPIRVYPSGYSDAAGLAGIKNPLYADINSSTVDNDLISNALAFGMPIIFSGCTTSNSNIWSVLAKGVMANLNLNITPEEFASYLVNEYDKAVTITPSSASLSVSSGNTTTITAATGESSPAGYVYGYCLNPLVATVKETTFGASAGFTVTGVSAGNTTLRLFTGTGEYVDVPVTVS